MKVWTFFALILIYLSLLASVAVCSIVPGNRCSRLSLSGEKFEGKWSKLVTIRGGQKKKLSWGKMFRAFWLSLIDPSNVENISNEQKKEAKKDSVEHQKKSGLFSSSSKAKGKSLQ
jgi:hypothetical protein